MITIDNNINCDRSPKPMRDSSALILESGMCMIVISHKYVDNVLIGWIQTVYGVLCCTRTSEVTPET